MTLRRSLLSFFLVASTALLLPGVDATAGKGGTPLDVNVHKGLAGSCDGTPTRLQGDDANCKTLYSDGEDCLNPVVCIPLRVQLLSNEKTLALDTRGTDGPRKLVLNFEDDVRCPTAGCSFPASTTIAGILKVPGLLEVLLNVPFTSLNLGDIAGGPARFWFTDPTDGVAWRVDWPTVTVTRTTAGWDLQVNATEEVGLSRLTGKRTKPGDFGNAGVYKLPLLLDAAVQP